LRAEQEAQAKQNETETGSSQKRRKTGSGGVRFSLAPVGPIVSEYETDQRMTRIQREVKRIRDEMKLFESIFETIEKPNRKQRRAFDAIVRRFVTELDNLPNR